MIAIKNSKNKIVFKRMFYNSDSDYVKKYFYNNVNLLFEKIFDF